jgi:hypothetical protein
MTPRQWKLLFVINLITILVVLSPFLPGPSSLSELTNTIFSVLQLGSLLGFILIPIGLLWTITQNKAYIKGQHNCLRLLPILLWTIPLVVFVSCMWFSDLARNFSRRIAINNASSLINAIEAYKVDKGVYPHSIEMLQPWYLKKAPDTFIMGIPGYTYVELEKSFNVSFVQNVIAGFNFEIVVYDPKNQHHSQGSTLPVFYQTGKKNWKYYLYD